MQEHWKGKSHRRKAPKLQQPMTEAAQAEEDLPKNMTMQGIFAKPNGSTALSNKQKNHDVTATSTVLVTTGEKDLRCTLCGITTTDEKGMQDHLKGKIHRKKAGVLALPMAEENVVRSKSNGSIADLPAKRKREDSDVVAAASTLPPAASSKKENLACTVCGITTSDERGMQDHLKGKMHRKKAAATPAQPLPEAAEQEQHQPEQEDDAYTPKKIKMGIKTGKVQMDGFVLCEVCNVRTADIVTMMCHLDGGKHSSKVQQQQRKAEEKSPETVTIDETAAAVTGGDSETVTVEANTIDETAPAVAGGDSETVVTMEANGMSHTVRLLDGFLLCDCCDVKLPSVPESVMRSHLAGKKHAKKLKATGSTAADGKAITNDVAVAATKTQIPGTPPGHEVKVAPCAGDSAAAPMEISEESPETASTMDTAAVAKKHEVEVAPMEIEKHAAQVGDLTATMVDEEKEEAKVNSSVTQEQQAVMTEEGVVVTAMAGQEVKVQVEGQECTVLRQADGTLSCGLCGVHGRDKDGMLQHLYTRAHWHRVRSAQEIKEDVNNGDSEGIPVSEATTQVEN